MNKLNLQVLLSAVDKITAPFKSAEKATKQLSSALKQSYEERKKLEKQQALIESFKQAEKSLSKTSNEFELAKNKARELKKELKTTDVPTKNLTKTFEKQKKEVDELKLKHHRQVAKLKELKQKLTEVGIDSKRLGVADSQLKNKVDQVTKSIDKQKKALSDLNKQQLNHQKYQQRVATLKAKSESLQNFGQRSLVTGGAVLGTGYKLFKPAVEFEQSFSKVIALTRLDKNNAEQAKKIEALKKQAIDLGATTAFSSGEVAQAQGYLAMAGFTPEQIQQSLQSVLNMALASGMDLSRVSDVASDIASGFKIPASEMSRVADVLTMTTTTSNTSLETLYETMKEGAPVMTSLGQSFESTAALAGLLGNVGIKGSNAGTTIKNIGLNLVNNKHLKKLGVSATDAAGNMRAIPEILADIKKKTDKMGTGKRADVIKSIFGMIPVAGALELISQADKALIEYEKSIKHSKDTAEKAAKTMSDNLIGDLKGLNSAWEAIGISLYTEQSKGLRELTQTATAWLRKLNDWIKANPELTAKIIKWVGAISAGAVALGALSIVSSYVLYPIFRLGLGLGKITKLLFPMNVNIRKTVTGLLSWKTTGKGVANIFSSLGRFIVKLINPMTYLSNGFNLVTTAGRGLLLVSRLFIATPLGLIITALAVGAMLIYKNWDKVKAFFGGFFDGLMSGLSPVLEKFKPLGDIFSVVVGWLKKAFDYISDLISPITSTSEELNSATEAGKKFGEGLAAAIDFITTPIQWLIEKLKWITDKLDTLSVDKFKSWFSFGSDDNKNSISSRIDYQSVDNVTGFASGGFTGSGGRYDPAGIVHKGEFVFNKSATSRLGTGFLSSLHNSKSAKAGMLAAGLSSSVAFAQPFQVDTRPPLNNTQPVSQATNSPMNITINIQASNQNPQQLADTIRREIEKVQRQQEVQRRSRLFDRE